MSDATAGQPVEVPGDPPGSSTVAHEQDVPENHNGAGPSSPAGGHSNDGAPAGALAEDSGRANGAASANGTGAARGAGGTNGTGGTKRRRGARGGRGRGRAASDGSQVTGSVPEDGSTPADPPAPTGSAEPVAPARAAPERPKIGDTRPARPNQAPVPVAGGGGEPDQRRTGNAPSNRNQGRTGSGRQRQRPAQAAGPRGSGGTQVSGPGTGAGGSPRAETGRAEGRRGGRERRGKAVGRYMICVHVRPEMTQIALLEGRTLVEHYISRASDDATQIDGNIYRGRVQNVLPGMEAAFVDIGTPKNAVLYHGDVRYDTDDVESGTSSGQPRIEQLLRPGQTILCQVTKNPIGAKGARLTQEVSLPGRFVVLVPNSSAYGISKRLEDGERKRLRKIVDAVRPPGHGLIVRTAAAGASAEELGNDVQRLVDQWETIAGEATKGQGAALLYREPAIAVRVIREELNREYRAVVIDDLALYEQVRDYVGAVNPELADRVEYFDPEVEALPVFERYHVHEQLHRALDRKVYLPSGGSLVIDRTEALTVIDVNTGKNVGTTNLEETVYRNNLEAAEEVARQLRLRDIGGIIVIDFIDMEIRENRDKVGSALRSALARDKTRTQVFDISELGLVEMTRKRVSEGLIESMSTTCEVCGGRGIVFDDPEA
jgi:ribonuclease E